MLGLNRVVENVVEKIKPERLLIVAIIIISLLLAINLDNKIAAFAFIVFLLLTPIVISNTKIFLIILISIKMVVNGLYAIDVVGDINILQIIGVFMPLFLMFYMAVKKIDFKNYFIYPLIFIFLIEILVGSIITMYDTHNFNELEKLFRLLNGLTCYFAIPLIFKKENEIKIFMLAWMISVLFPLLIALYQLFTGSFHFQQVAGLENLSRIAGLYHDVGTVAYSGQIFILIHFFFQKKYNSKLKNILWIIILLVVAYLIYRTYSKGAAVLLVTILFLWSIYSKRKLLLIITAIIVMFVFLYERSGVYKRIERDLYARQEFGDRLMFSGRVGIWQKGWKTYLNYKPLNKLIGHETYGSHNDFLRVLLDYGFLGLIIYLTILTVILIKLLQLFRYATSDFYKKLTFIAFLSHIAFIIMCFGTTPSLLTDYQWFHWGLVGLAMIQRHKYEADNKPEK